MHTVGADSRPEYYRQSAATVMEALGSHKMGLTNATAERRHQKAGANILPVFHPRPPLAEWFGAAVHPLTLGLIITALLALATGLTALAIVLLLTLLVNVSIRFTFIRSATPVMPPELSEHSVVVRNGQIRRIETAKLVVGDIVMLKTGDTVPADMRLLSVDGLSVHELILFGVGESVKKLTRSIRTEVPFSGRMNMAWAGTRVASGTAAGIVTDIGAQTELGRIIVLANNVQADQKLLQLHVNRAWLAAGIVYAGAAAFGIATGIDAPRLLLGLVILGLSLLPLGLYPAYLITLLRLRPRSDTALSALSSLGAVDTLLTSERSVARFKAFGLHVLHVGHRTSTIPLRELQDEQLLRQIQSGSATFGELNAEEKLRLVRAVQSTGHNVAVMAQSISDMPAQLQAKVSGDAKDLAAHFAAARSVAVQAKLARRVIVMWTIALSFVAAASLGSLWYIHTPPTLSPQLIMLIALAALPLAAARPWARFHASTPELVSRAVAAATVTCAAFLFVFGLHNVDPSYIDPSHPLVLQATSAAFAVFILCMVVDQLLSPQKNVVLGLVMVLGLLIIIYSPGLQVTCGTSNLDAAGWLITWAGTGLFVALRLLQNHTRHHSRAAVIALHHKTYGKASGVKI